MVQNPAMAWEKEKGINHLFFSNQILLVIYLFVTSIFHGLSCTFEDMISLHRATEEEWTPKGRSDPSTKFEITGTTKTSQLSTIL
jgi:hypothetical protein